MDNDDFTPEEFALITECAKGNITIHHLIKILGCTDKEAASLVNDEILRIVAER